MSGKVERRGLGRGLSALLADVGEGAARPLRPEAELPIDRIRPNAAQPRRDFSAAALEELAASIRAKGVLQPIIVRPLAEDRYEIVAGERRWRAAQMAGLHRMPVVVRELTDGEVLEIGIVENIQRADLNAIEEAMAYSQLIERFGHTQEMVADALSKSRSHVANLLRLLKLPAEVQAHVRDGRLTAGHARALVTAVDPVALAQKVLSRGMSVRETEALARADAPAERQRARPKGEKDADTRALEADLAAALGMKVAIEHEPGGQSGRLVIGYDTLEQLDDLCRALSAMRR